MYNLLLTKSTAHIFSAQHALPPQTIEPFDSLQVVVLVKLWASRTNAPLRSKLLSLSLSRAHALVAPVS